MNITSLLIAIQFFVTILFGTNQNSGTRQKDKIGMFDLKYTLGYNLKDSLQVLSLWDDIHALSTLQGVVNRGGPHLYINYGHL